MCLTTTIHQLEVKWACASVYMCDVRTKDYPTSLASPPGTPQHCDKDLQPKYAAQLNPKPKPEPKKEAAKEKPKAAEGEAQGEGAVAEGGEKQQEEGETQAVAEVTKEEPKGQPIMAGCWTHAVSVWLD